MWNFRTVTILGMIFTAAAARLVPHPPNFTPIAAMALFGGAHLPSRRAAFLVPLSAMFLSDVVIGLHSGMAVVYGCFAATVCLGLWLRRRRTGLRVASAAVAGAVLFFFVTNFAVWAMGSLYPKTPAGLFVCYVAAIPFFRNTLAGDALYTAVLFGGFALAERRYTALQEVSAETR